MKTRSAILAALALFLLITPAGAHAWVDLNVCNSGGEPRWSAGAHPVYELNCSPNGYTVATSLSDTGAQYNVLNAMTSAYSMWTKDGTSTASHYIDSSQCLSGPEDGAWFEGMASDTGGTSELWYEPNSTMVCTATALGCAAFHYKCLLQDQIYSADIAINQSPSSGWDIISQNTLSECLMAVRRVWGLTALHEVGHTYDLGHEEGEINMMRSTGSGVRPRNCHVGLGFQPQPFPDDMNGLMSFYRNFPTSSPAVNYTGTAFYLNGMDGVLANNQFWVSTNTQLVYIPWTVESMYRSTSTTVTVYYRVVLIPNTGTSGLPLFNSSTKVWTFPSGSKFYGQRYVTASDPSLDELGFSAFNGFSESIVGTTLTSGTQYRVWLQVDPSGNVAEVDEGDNVFPTNIRVTRL